MGKPSPAFLYANCIPFPHPPFHGHLIRVSSTYPFSARAPLASVSCSLAFAISLCCCVRV